MVSKAKIKEIQSLGIKKFRDEKNIFVAEGDKLVGCLLPSFACECLIATARWIDKQGVITASSHTFAQQDRTDKDCLLSQGAVTVKELIIAKEDEIQKAGFLKTPHDVLAVFRKPCYAIDEANPASQLILALDGIQDPGNLGTIIRLAEWFGIEHIICSRDTADAFSPKTVQATMGALANVKIHYTNLEEYITVNPSIPIYGTFLNGENIYESVLSQQGIIVMGNEGNGIRLEIEPLINKRLYIPSYHPDRLTTGSLNVATATDIVCAAFRLLRSYQ